MLFNYLQRGPCRGGSRLLPRAGGIRRGGGCADTFRHEAGSTGMVGCQQGAGMFPRDVEGVLTQSQDVPKGGGRWDVHRLQMGWQRSGRAPGSSPVTDGKQFNPLTPCAGAGGGRLPHHLGDQPEPGLVLPAPQLLLQLLAVAWSGRATGWQPQWHGWGWGAAGAAASWAAGASQGPTPHPQAGPCDGGGHSISARKVWILRSSWAGDLGMDAGVSLQPRPDPARFSGQC